MDRGSKSAIIYYLHLCDGGQRREDDCTRFITNLLAGMLLTGVLVLASPNLFARGGGGGGGEHFGGGGQVGGFHGGFAAAESGRGAWIPRTNCAGGSW